MFLHVANILHYIKNKNHVVPVVVVESTTKKNYTSSWNKCYDKKMLLRLISGIYETWVIVIL